jgi:hypothetical protein
MLKAIIIFLLTVGLGLFLVFQVILPLFIKKLPLFWSFRKSAVQEQAPASSLDDLETEVDSTMAQYRETSEKVDSVLEKAQELKEKTEK